MAEAKTSAYPSARILKIKMNPKTALLIQVYASAMDTTWLETAWSMEARSIRDVIFTFDEFDADDHLQSPDGILTAM